MLFVSDEIIYSFTMIIQEKAGSKSLLMTDNLYSWKGRGILYTAIVSKTHFYLCTNLIGKNTQIESNDMNPCSKWLWKRGTEKRKKEGRFSSGCFNEWIKAFPDTRKKCNFTFSGKKKCERKNKQRKDKVLIDIFLQKKWEIFIFFLWQIKSLR